MRIEVLLSTMNQKNFDIVEKCNIKSDAIIINQCNEEKIEIKKYSFGVVKMIYSKTRGLSKSRNLALENAKGDICILCDDDIVYYDNYVSIIENAFYENSTAIKNNDRYVLMIADKHNNKLYYINIRE